MMPGNVAATLMESARAPRSSALLTLSLHQPRSFELAVSDVSISVDDVSDSAGAGATCSAAKPGVAAVAAMVAARAEAAGAVGRVVAGAAAVVGLGAAGTMQAL